MELEFIEWLRASENPHRQLSLGIGDDAALWRPTPGLEQVLTTDLLLDEDDLLDPLDDEVPAGVVQTLAQRRLLVVEVQLQLLHEGFRWIQCHSG